MRLKKTAVALAASLALVLGGSAAYAIDQFGDVPDSNGFHDDVNWLVSRNITFGCNTAGTLYCPSANVTRGQMAAFLRRQAGVVTPDLYGTGEAYTTESDGLGSLVVCNSVTHVSAPYESAAVVSGSASLNNGDVVAVDSVWVFLVYSVDGGASWNTFNFGAPETTIGAGEEAIISAHGVVPLTPNTSYMFGLQVRGNPVSGGFGFCDMTVSVHHQMPGALMATGAPISK